MVGNLLWPVVSPRRRPLLVSQTEYSDCSIWGNFFEAWEQSTEATRVDQQLGIDRVLHLREPQIEESISILGGTSPLDLRLDWKIKHHQRPHAISHSL